MAHLKHKCKIVSKADSARLPVYQAWGTPSMSQGLRKPHQYRPEPMLCERLGVPARHRPLIPTLLFQRSGKGSHRISEPTRSKRAAIGVLGTEGAGGAHLGFLCDGEPVGHLTESCSCPRTAAGLAHTMRQELSQISSDDITETTCEGALQSIL